MEVRAAWVRPEPCRCVARLDERLRKSGPCPRQEMQFAVSTIIQCDNPNVILLVVSKPGRSAFDPSRIGSIVMEDGDK
ncbi:hypothetical protein N7516_001497 [Penicillium verrucosum]|uniref:uncharacterized protein n=1 Tax=Penicillium verrucosum TaxID=60171 RepID=UPI002544D6C9|nr:uncharacterized protein N7516_001497 [Penicillium verrucosum]KAJ5941329.1 hypothetical protein N7516_001497 [Penicillium verrucosum]